MITFDRVSYAYETGGSQKRSLQDLDFTIEAGECVVLCGASGCGKTTVTRLINGLIPHYYEGELTGCVSVGGRVIAEQPLARTALEVGSVFQNPRSQFFNVDTTDELAFGCENQALPVMLIEKRIDEVRTLFELDELMDRSIFELSGGEKQRIACASVHAAHPSVVVLDEPSSNLDTASIELLRKTIGVLKAEGKTVVISEHRLYYLADLADRYFYMEEGRLARVYSAEEMRSLPQSAFDELCLRTLSLETLTDCRPTYRATHSRQVFACEDIVCSYDGKVALDVLDLQLPENGIVAVVGHNGAGKSTFANCLCGLCKHRGAVRYRGGKVKPRQRIKLSYMVMQDVNHQLFTESVLEEVSLNVPHAEIPKVDAVLKRLGLTAYREQHPLSLSGGQKQRVAIASALCSGKEILVYDEPTSGLDCASMRAVCELIDEAADDAALSLVVTHDLEFILACCTSVLHIAQGSVRDSYLLDVEGVSKVKAFFTAG